MSTVLGVNKYSSLKNLIANKIGLTAFNGNLYTRWGKLFEPVTTALITKILNTDIHETGSIPCINREGIKYSPDGIGVVGLKNVSLKQNDVSETEYYTVLFEFKSPFNSIPDGSIPAHYIPQPLTGMCSIPDIDIAIFVNSLYRKCCLNQFNYDNEYDIEYYSDKKKNIEFQQPYALGIIYFYQTRSQRRIFKFGLDNTVDDLIDFGSENTDLNKIMQLYERNLISILYCDKSMIISDIINENPFIKKHVQPLPLIKNLYKIDYVKKLIKKRYMQAKEKHCHMIGFLPWKLFKIDIILQYKDINFLEKNKENIDKALKIITTINEGDPPLDIKIRRFEEIFSPINKRPVKIDNDLLNDIYNL